MLHVASVCTPSCMLLDVVACCCAKFKTGQTFLPTTPNISLFRDRRSVAQQCWTRLHSSSYIVGATHAHYAWITKAYGLYSSHDALQVPNLLGVVASFCTPLPTHTQQLATLLAQQCWELLRPFVRGLKRQTYTLHITHYFHGGIVVCAYPIFWSCVHVHFYFSPPLIFNFLAASISHFLTAALNFHVFLARNSSPLFSITRSSSFSVIHVSVNIKNNAEKDTTLLLLFLSKSPGGHVISFQIKPWVALPVEWVILHWYACGAVGRSVGRSVGWCTVTCLPNFLGWVDYHISLTMGIRPRAALRAARGAPLLMPTLVLNVLFTF